MIQSEGICPTCDQETVFKSYDDSWLRSHFLCSKCHSVPRERALMATIEQYYPNWRDLHIHESSPCGRGASVKLQKHCKHYDSSQFYPDLKRGEVHPQSGYRNEDLENLTLADESFDLLVSQDVMEHIFDYDRVFNEIARVLKPGGAHIFTVPLINKSRPSAPTASRKDGGEIEYHVEPVYHGNPADEDKGALVTMHWGYDICDYIYKSCGLPTTIIYIDDLTRGIRAEYIEVLVTRKTG